MQQQRRSSVLARVVCPGLEVQLVVCQVPPPPAVGVFGSPVLTLRNTQGGAGGRQPVMLKLRKLKQEQDAQKARDAMAIAEGGEARSTVTAGELIVQKGAARRPPSVLSRVYAALPAGLCAWGLKHACPVVVVTLSAT